MKLVASVIIFGTLSSNLLGDASKVEIVKGNAGYQLLRNGKPFFIKGAGGNASKELLSRAGANSFRTWGIEDAARDLEEGEKNHLAVTLGIWLGHVEQGFDYKNADLVKRQLESARASVTKYKDHPSLLIWSLGNESEGGGGSVEYYKALNEIARETKVLDPNHPTMTVIAELGGNKVADIHKYCPDIDIIGINSYGGGASVLERYVKSGGVKPYILTEFGPPGPWETAKSSWGAAYEMSSTQKAAFVKTVYSSSVLKSQGLCLGSYAFTWGAKQEGTATWFGLLLTDASRLAAVDTLQEFWTGQAPTNSCPSIGQIASEKGVEGAPGSVLNFSIPAQKPNSKTRWSLQKENTNYQSNGNWEATPPELKDSILSENQDHVQIKIPSGLGGYRLFAYVRDGNGGAATANIPIFSKDPDSSKRGNVSALPVKIYAEGVETAFHPSGYMGEVASIKMDPNCETDPHSGKKCLKVVFSNPGSWGGVVWQNPANDWGDQFGGLDLTGAKKLTFWAKGANGDEWITFQYGLIGKDKKYFDTASGKIGPLKLDKQWIKYTFDLAGKELWRVKTGFCWVLAGQGKPVTFYLDDITIE